MKGVGWQDLGESYFVPAGSGGGLESEMCKSKSNPTISFLSVELVQVGSLSAVL